MTPIRMFKVNIGWKLIQNKKIYVDRMTTDGKKSLTRSQHQKYRKLFPTQRIFINPIFQRDAIENHPQRMSKIREAEHELTTFEKI